jgi:hypothetical protein
MEDAEDMRDDMDKEEIIREKLSMRSMKIVKENALLFKHIDSFVTMSQENTSVTEVMLYPFDSDAGSYGRWDKVGHMVGNLKELTTLNIHFLPYTDPYCYEYGNDDGKDDSNDEAHIPDWEILTRILPYLRRQVSLCVITEHYDAEVEKIQGLARAIHGHPMISEFSSQAGFNLANVGAWCSALATLPSLEKVTLGFEERETEDQRDLVNLEPLKELLLQAPALRFVVFEDFYFTNALCHIQWQVHWKKDRQSLISLSIIPADFLMGGELSSRTP